MAKTEPKKKLTDKELADARLRIIFWWQRTSALLVLLFALQLLPFMRDDVVMDWIMAGMGVFIAVVFLFSANTTRKHLGFKWLQF